MMKLNLSDFQLLMGQTHLVAFAKDQRLIIYMTFFFIQQIFMVSFNQVFDFIPSLGTLRPVFMYVSLTRLELHKYISLNLDLKIRTLLQSHLNLNPFNPASTLYRLSINTPTDISSWAPGTESIQP